MGPLTFRGLILWQLPLLGQYQKAALALGAWNQPESTDGQTAPSHMSCIGNWGLWPLTSAGLGSNGGPSSNKPLHKICSVFLP